MKHKYSFFTIFIVLLIASFGPATALAQTLHGGAVFGTDYDIGIKVGAYLGVAENIDAGGDFIYFFPDGFDAYEININGRYLIPLESFTLHGIAGLNYTNISFGELNDLCGSFGFACDASASEIGLNVGGMASFGSGPLGFYADAKFVIGGSEQLEIGGGITFRLGS